MKRFLRLFLLSSALLLVVQCFEEHGIQYDYTYVIPKADRYTFGEGDILLYRSSQGIIDSVRVNEVTFYTEPGAGINGFGVTYVFKMDHYRVTLEPLTDHWNRILQEIYVGVGEDDGCLQIETYFNVQTYFDPDDPPGAMLTLGCGEDGGKLIADSDPEIGEQTIGSAVYRDIYSCSCQEGDSAGADIFWNLKYGIIRFGGMLDGSYVSWDLVKE